MTKPKSKSEPVKTGPKIDSEPNSEAIKPLPLTTWMDQVMGSLSVDTDKGKLRLKKPVNDVLHQIGYFFDDKVITKGLKQNEQLEIAAAVIERLREGSAA